MSDINAPLKANVSMLGQLLGDTIGDHLGEGFVDKVETIRQLAKASRQREPGARHKMLELLNQLSDQELVPFARAFNQFLNLANMAEQFHTISRNCDQLVCVPDPVDLLFGRLLNGKAQLDPQVLLEELGRLEIDLVLTAHPTEISRRTLITKYSAIIECLAELENPQLSEREHHQQSLRLRQLIAQIWHTNEIRTQRPTPEDEASWGWAAVEDSLWQAVPDFLRQLNDRLEAHAGVQLPPDTVPVKFSSWMGGDRDGNPNVTAKVSARVLLKNRKMALTLYLQDVKTLISELSMVECSDELAARVGDTNEPYRVELRRLRDRLLINLEEVNGQLDGFPSSLEPEQRIQSRGDLLQPLQLIYDSLLQSNMRLIANGLLLDTLRRVHCFGIGLIRLDIRQDAARHESALAEITRFLGLGDYEHWQEEEKQAFLLRELANRRPLLPGNWTPSNDTKEVLDTCKLIALQQAEAMGSYVISMASSPSDVLAVALLLKECGCPFTMPIVPLFETLDDLQNAADSVEQLLAIDWYHGYIRGKQQVMIGYSDSAKDAGVMAASWAQYRAQESLVEVCKAANVDLTLFHGRGGSIGRGGGPAHEAILSQPPGSVDGRLRVTEQGEMIRFKFGLPKVAVQSLALYTSAVLEATLLPPPQPKQAWRELMDSIAASSVDAYRSIVRDEPQFVPYFRAATPEQELADLPLGSRPAKRRADGGVESLRAIPWIFAWTQNRLMLPAWLGAGAGLKTAIDAGEQPTLTAMFQSWPFFRTRLSMLEMVYAKAEPHLAAYYDRVLVPQELHGLGTTLRKQLEQDIETVLQLTQEQALMEHTPWNRESVELRHPYIDPLNFLQAELLRRCRGKEEELDDIRQALMITIAGIAAGMRNTG
ncbi:Phosphoenolpyruvate carboxylase, type 1 [Ferrimonas sediminum]|uniref:Phosphoenolpyruvate carboxylase n=1 Tax=Ferrimonas sediminum TaxID=718193 RepID=A0A1G8V783_9GAMM|nr:phosphoenolpyruvate carboxylase [Ferrimonas sediminum]SDJ61921.1 Phosphoenolpyruvate carboxylase, type 1 [Ferrimonas sediminum]